MIPAATTARRSWLIAGLAGCVLASGAALAAPGEPAVDPAVAADFRRAAAAVSLSTSDQPALRAEAQARAPSPGFRLGAAHAAWVNAAAQLAFDVANPTAAGPPHASQNGALAQFLADDCREEAAAFASLDSAAQALALKPGAVAALAGADAAALSSRATAAPLACRQ